MLYYYFGTRKVKKVIQCDKLIVHDGDKFTISNRLRLNTTLKYHRAH